MVPVFVSILDSWEQRDTPEANTTQERKNIRRDCVGTTNYGIMRRFSTGYLNVRVVVTNSAICGYRLATDSLHEQQELKAQLNQLVTTILKPTKVFAGKIREEAGC